MRPSEALLRGWGAREGGSCSEVRPGLRCCLPKTLVCAEPGWLQSGSSCSVTASPWEPVAAAGRETSGGEG